MVQCYAPVRSMSTTPAHRLTTTSYALLAELALQPWTTYELTKQMRGNVRYLWPRAESRVYEEAKRLVERGLATAERGFTGRRPRTVYAITDAGRRELAAWLDRAPAPGFALEYEAMLKVFFASLGNPDGLRRAVQAVGDDGAAMRAVGDRLAAEYRAGTSPFQHEEHVRALTFDFLYTLAAHLDAWAARTRAEVASWGDMDPKDKEARALEIIEGVLDAAARLPRGHPPGGSGGAAT